MGEGWWRWALVSLDEVAPSWMVGVSASVSLPLHHKVHQFSSGTGSPGWSRKKGRKTVVVIDCKAIQTRMWANAQRDGRPAEYRWRPLFNAAKFG